MRKALLWLIPILLLSITMYFFVFNWLVPKTAAFTTPMKWRMLPMRQHRNIVRDYLGEPVGNDTTGKLTTDEWDQGGKGKNYLLRIDYALDSTAISYSIHYRYSNRLMGRDYLIDSFSIK